MKYKKYFLESTLKKEAFENWSLVTAEVIEKNWRLEGREVVFVCNQ